MTQQLSVDVFNAHMALVKATKFKRAEVHVPDTVVDLFRAVDTAYVPSGGKKSWASDAERVAFLFDLYQRLTSLLPAPARPARKARNRPVAKARGGQSGNAGCAAPIRPAQPEPLHPPDAGNPAPSGTAARPRP